MSHEIKANRPATGPLPTPLPKPEPGPAPTAGPSPVKKAKTDTLELKGTGAASAPKGVEATIANAPATPKERVTYLQDAVKSRVPGATFKTKQGAEWTPKEMESLLKTVDKMTPTDRMHLAGMNFVRAKRAELSEEQVGAIAKQTGKDPAEVRDMGARAMALFNAQPGEKGPASTTGEGFLQSAEQFTSYIVERLFGKTPEGTAGEKAADRSIVLTDENAHDHGHEVEGKPESMDEIWTHEIGHQVQMGGQGWNPEKIAEFAKLSNWREDYGDGDIRAYDGMNDETGKAVQGDVAVVTPGVTDNIVSDYAKTSPVEDFAESYRTYYNNPGELMEKAPDKFLYINAMSHKYSAPEVEAFAKSTGTDLRDTVTHMVNNSGLKQAVLNEIIKVNGVSPHKEDLKVAAQVFAHSGDGLTMAWSKMTMEVKTPQDVERVAQDPKAFLGEAIWNKLEPAEQSVLSRADFVKDQLGNIMAGRAGVISSADRVDLAVNRDGAKQLLDGILKNPEFRKELSENPGKALKDSGIEQMLPEEVVKAIAENRSAVTAMATAMGTLWDSADEGQRSKYADNLDRALTKAGPENFNAFATVLNGKDDLAASLMESAMKTGSVVHHVDGGPPVVF